MNQPRSESSMILYNSFCDSSTPRALFFTSVATSQTILSWTCLSICIFFFLTGGILAFLSGEIFVGSFIIAPKEGLFNQFTGKEESLFPMFLSLDFLLIQAFYDGDHAIARMIRRFPDVDGPGLTCLADGRGPSQPAVGAAHLSILGCTASAWRRMDLAHAWRNFKRGQRCGTGDAQPARMLRRRQSIRH